MNASNGAPAVTGRKIAASGPAVCMASSVSACWISVPLILSSETSAPGGCPPRSWSRNRRFVISSAISSTSTRVRRSAKRRSSSRPASLTSSFTRASSRLQTAMFPVPMRSWPSRNFATVQPLFSSCTRCSAGTRTSSKKTSFTS